MDPETVTNIPSVIPSTDVEHTNCAQKKIVCVNIKEIQNTHTKILKKDKQNQFHQCNTQMHAFSHLARPHALDDRNGVPIELKQLNNLTNQIKHENMIVAGQTQT
jgi:hypothetical protein